MLERLEHRLPDVAYKLLEGRIAGEIYSQENRIGKQPHHLLELSTAPPDYRRTHQQVILSGQVMKHRLKRREHDYIERRALSLRECFEPRAQFAVQDEIM